VAQPTVTVSALLQHTDQYDGKVVSVARTITAYREGVSAKGNPYTTLRLEDGGSSIPVSFGSIRDSRMVCESV